MRGGVDPRALIETREERKARALGEMYAWLVSHVGMEHAPLYWQMVPEDLKRTASGIGNWLPILSKVVNAGVVRSKTATTDSPKNPYME